MTLTKDDKQYIQETVRDTVVEAIEQLVLPRFDEHDKRFDEHDKRFDGIERDIVDLKEDVRILKDDMRQVIPSF